MEQTDLERIWRRTLAGRDVDGIDPAETLRPMIAEDSLSGMQTLSGTSTRDGDSLSGAPTIAPDGGETLSDESTISGACGAPQPDETSSLHVPSSWDRWQARGADDSLCILAEIARGGMGVVYRARQESLAREVAVKQIIPGKVSADYVERFISEGLITAMLDHPNIVPVHDMVETAGGEICLAMKLVGGTSWKDLLHPASEVDRLKADGYELKDHLGILRNVCNAVAYAHSKGIVHLDLKPANVMVGEFGEVLVMDWGIAVDCSERAGEDSVIPHRSGIVSPSGTPRYLAPEMAEGRGELIGPWSDVFLLGAILHELLTGVPPHRGQGMYAILQAACRAEAPVFPDAVPEGLAEICRKALARQPGDRYKDPTAFSAALGEYLEHRESQLIAARAEQQLAESTALTGDDHVERYAGFAEAVAGFKQALHLWDGNAAAREGRNRAAIAYAEAALAAGDLALAASQAASIDETHPQRDRLVPAVRSAQAQADRARRHQRFLRRSLVSAVVLIITGLAVGTVLVERARGAAEVARQEAESQERAAVEAREAAQRSELATQHEAWRMRLTNAKALYDLGLERLAAGAVDAAGASFLAAYKMAPVDRVPAGFEPGPGMPDHASFAWRALHLQQLEQAADRRLRFAGLGTMSDIAIGSGHVLFVAGSRKLAAVDLDTNEALWCLPLPCRELALDDARQRLLVTTADDRPPLLIDLQTGAQERLPYQREGDFTFLYHHPRAANCTAWDQRNHALVTWNLDPVAVHEDKRFTEKYPVAMHYRGEGELHYYEMDKPPRYPAPWTMYSVELEYHGKETRPSFRSPDGRTHVVLRTRPGSIMAELKRNPWGVAADDLRVFPGPDGNYPSNLLRIGQLADNGRMAIYVKDRLHLLDLRLNRVVDGRPMPFLGSLKAACMDPAGSIMAYTLASDAGLGGVFVVRTRSGAFGNVQAVWNLADEKDGLRLDFASAASSETAFKAGAAGRLMTMTASTHARHVLAVTRAQDGARSLHIWQQDRDRPVAQLPLPAGMDMDVIVHSAGDGRHVAIQQNRGNDSWWRQQNDAWADVRVGGERREWRYRPPALWFIDTHDGRHRRVDFALPADDAVLQGDNYQRFRCVAIPGSDLVLCYDGRGIVALSADGRRGVRLAPPELVDLTAGAVNWSPAGSAFLFSSLELLDEALRMRYDRNAVLAALAQAPVDGGERIDAMALPLVEGCLRVESKLVFQRRPARLWVSRDAEYALLHYNDRSIAWVSGRNGAVIWQKHGVRGNRAAIDPTGKVTAIWNKADEAVRFYDNTTGTVITEVVLAIPTDKGRSYPSLVWSADGCRLMIGNDPSGQFIELFAPSVRDPAPAGGDPVLEVFRQRAGCDVGMTGASWGQVDKHELWVDLEQAGPPQAASL